MKRSERRVAIPSRWFWALTLAAGCLLGRSEESVKSEFNAYVSAASQCDDAKDCAVAYAACPLGCFVAVRADRKDDVEKKAKDLVAAYERGGSGCAYDCDTPDNLICLGGRCTFGHAAQTGSGGNGGSGGKGGGGAGTSSGGPNRTAFVTLSPVDGTTATDGMAIALTLTDPGSVLDPATVERMRSAVVLATWPEKTNVAATVTTMVVGGSTDALLRVTPTSALADRWYVLALTDLPSGVVPATLLPDGSVAVRFRPASQPRVRTVEICEKEVPGAKLVLTFSEPVTYPPVVSDLVSLSIDGAASPCDVYDAPVGGLYLSCAQLTGTSHAAISVGTGIQGVTGVAMQPAAFNVDVATLASNGGCRKFVPDVP